MAAVLLLLLAAAAPSGADLSHQVRALEQRIVELEQELSDLTSAVRAQHPDPAMEQEAVRRLGSVQALVRRGETERARAEMDDLMASYSNTAAGRKAATLAAELSVVGREAPADWGFTGWFQGEGDVELDSQRPTVLVFWETWCPHCRREVPKLQALHDAYADRGLQVLGISRLSRGASEEAMRAFIDQHDLRFPLARDDGRLSAHFGVGGIPAVAVLRSGRVVWRGHPAHMAPEMLESWLD